MWNNCHSCAARGRRRKVWAMVLGRRSFLRFAALGVASLALPTVPLFASSTGARDYRTVVIPQRKLMARIRITGEAMAASKGRPPGEMWRQALRDEYASIAADFERMAR